MATLRRMLGLVLLVGVNAWSAAQDAAPKNPLDAIRDKEAISDEERNTLKSWIDERVSMILSVKDVEGAERAVVDLRGNRNGSARFKELYAEIALERIAAALKGAELAPASRLLGVLNSLSEAKAYTILVEALRDERAAVRTTAAVGLRTLRVKLSLAGGPYFSETLSALRDAGKRETSPVALKTIYQALNFPEVAPNPHDPKANAAAVLDLLEARAQHYQTPSAEHGTEGADAVGLATGGALRQFMSEQERERFIIVVAQMLKYAVTRYTTGDNALYKVQDKSAGSHLTAQRNNVELLIEEAEKQLTDLFSGSKLPAPTIADAMKRAANPTDMKIAMNKWGKLLKEAVKQEFYLEESGEPGSGDGG